MQEGQPEEWTAMIPLISEVTHIWTVCEVAAAEKATPAEKVVPVLRR